MINPDITSGFVVSGGGAVAFVCVIIFGLVIGSFLNVCIFRIPQKESIVWPSSRCPECGYKISAWDNVPILSYFILKGLCRSCKAPISPQYPLVEFLTALLFVLVFSRYQISTYTLLALCFTAILIVVTFIDLKHRIIPNILNYLGIILAGIGLVFSLLPISPITGAIGFLLGGGFFYLAAVMSPILFKKEGMGGGDIKLIAFIGLFLGWQNVLLTIFLGSFIGAVLGIGMIITGARDKKDLIPFGPYLSLAAFFALIQGDVIIDWYLRFALN